MSQENIRTFQGHTPQLGERVFVDPMSVVTGQVELGDDVSIWPCTSVRGDLLDITIGARTNIQDNSLIHTTHDSAFYSGNPCHIGSDVTVGHGVILHACQVEDRSLIGMGAIVLDGAVIESEVFVAAGSLVPPGKVLKRGYLYVGNPVKQARALTEKELEYFIYSAKHYVELKDAHIASLSSRILDQAEHRL